MKLTDARRRKGLAQYELAGLASVPQSELYRIERRGMRPTREQALRLATSLGVDPSDVDELRVASELARTTDELEAEQ